MATTPIAERDARIAAIADAALVRQQLTQAANYRRLPSGKHEITVFDHQAGELRTFTGKTLATAIAKARLPGDGKQGGPAE